MSTSNMDGKFENPQGNCDKHNMSSSLPSRDLPVHIVELILNRLSWLEALSLGRVCRTWKAAVQNYSPVGTQGPCLLHLGLGTVRLFSMDEKSCSVIQQSNLNGECCGAYKSWLVFRDPPSDNMSIVNVITGASIKLPFLQIQGDIFVTLLSNPATRHCLLLAEVRNKKESNFFSCRPGYDEWDALGDLSDTFLLHFSALSEEKLYFAEESFLFVLDLIFRANSDPSLVDSWRFMDKGELGMHLIKHGTEILVVLALKENKNGPINNFSVFQFKQEVTMLNTKNMIYQMLLPQVSFVKQEVPMLNMKDTIYQMLLPQVSFVKVESLRNYAIFLGNVQSICFPVKNTGCKENCIYFTQPFDEIAWHIYDMENKSITDGPVLLSKANFRSLVWIEPDAV